MLSPGVRRSGEEGGASSGSRPTDPQLLLLMAGEPRSAQLCGQQQQLIRPAAPAHSNPAFIQSLLDDTTDHISRPANPAFF